MDKLAVVLRIPTAGPTAVGLLLDVAPVILEVTPFETVPMLVFAVFAVVCAVAALLNALVACADRLFAHELRLIQPPVALVIQ